MTHRAIRRIAVYCGSSPGSDLRFMRQAYELGATLARQGIGVVYGGATAGCMGAVADGALSEGGEVIGVLTRGLSDREIAHKGLTRLELVDTMHERKARMAALSEAVIALPGGFGTLDELFEALTWSQLGIDRKPVAVLDASGFWAPLLGMIDGATARGFVAQETRSLLRAVQSADEAIQTFKAII